MTTYRRVTVTVPAEVLKAADALARRLDRSRSWVVAEAVARYAATSSGDAAPSGSRLVVREEHTPPYEVRRAFRDAELSRLEGDLALTPEQRVRLAEEIARTAPEGRPRPRFRRVVQFDSYDDYLVGRRLAEVQP